MKGLEKKSIEDIFALTPMQEGMLYHYLQEPDSGYYFEQLRLEISGEIDIEIFEKAWHWVIQTNEMLRAVFRWENTGNPVQLILKNHRFKPRYACSEKKKTEDRRIKFDLREIPFKVTLCTHKDGNNTMIISNHHILYDGWSNGIILKEFFNAYRGLLNKEPLKPPLKKKFKEFVKWTLSSHSDKEETFWNHYLAELDGGAELPIKETPKEKTKNTNSGNRRILFSNELESQLREFVRRRKITLASLIYTAWGILLLRYNNCSDVIFGTTISGRGAGLDGIEETVGLFINTLPLRIRPKSNTTMAQLAVQVHDQLKQREEFSHTPLVKIKEYGKIDNSRELFDTLVIVENYPLDRELKSTAGPLTVQGYSMVERTHYPLTVTVNLLGGLEIDFAYDGNYLDKHSIIKLAHHFKTIVRHFVLSPDHGAGTLDILSTEEKEQLLVEFNRTRTDYPSYNTIHRLFEEQVDRTPHAVAAGFEDRKITFAGLNQSANRLARLLRDQGVASGDLVGLMPNRSIEMIVGLFAVLKAGGAYIPIGPEYPLDRAALILRECRAAILLTNRDREPPASSACVIYLDPVNATHDAKFDPGNLSPVSAPEDLAYVIHTSGTTGKPKGVMIENRAVVNFIKGITSLVPFTPNDSILSLTTLSFDIFGLETILALLKGCRLIVGNSQQQINPFAFAAALEREKITIFQATPSRLQLILAEEEPAGTLKQLKHLLVGGETFPQALLDKVKEITAGKTRIYNVYGPTETTIWSTLKELTGEQPLNIGKPIANTYIYILNKSGLPQPLGVSGELAIAGDGLARGYLNNPKLSREKFPSNPFDPGQKMYMTGDLARWLPDGNIELFGRIDHQLKIRGFRIEPGEIENRLMEIDFISEAVVTAVEEGGEKYLCAYFVPAKTRNTAKQRIEEIKLALLKNLPAYMAPAYFVELESLPLNVNGKIDRKALPKPQPADNGGYIAPASRTEEKLVKIWSGILNISEENIAVDANFFNLGGNSIKVMKLAARIRKELGTGISLPELSARPSIRELSQYIKNASPQRFASVEAAEKREYYPLAPTQRGIFLQHRTTAGARGYNMPQMMRLESQCNPQRLEQAFIKLIARHETLRTSFELINGAPSQIVHQRVDFKLEHFQAENSPESIENIFKHFIRPFDLAIPPLLRAGLIDIDSDTNGAGGAQLLMWDMHHIITDGVSLEITGAELIKLYSGEQLTPLSIHYKDYCLWRSSREIMKQIKAQGEFWLKMFTDGAPLLKMPYDRARPAVKSFEGKHLRFTVEEGLYSKLNDLSRETGATTYVILLTAYFVLLAKYSHQEDIVVGSPVAGRNHGDLEQIPGMFVNMMALRCRPQANKTFREFLSQVKELVMDALENQDFHFQELVAALGIRAENGRNPLFDVVFGMTTMDSPDNGSATGEDLKMAPYGLDYAPCPFDLLLGANEKENTIEMMLSYSTDLFLPASAEKTGKHFIGILEQAAADCNAKLNDFSITRQLVAAQSFIEEDGQEEFNF